MRSAAHALAFLVLWPMAAACFAPGLLAEVSTFAGAPARLLWLGSVAVVARMWREFAVVGLLLVLTTGLAARCLTTGRAEWRAWRKLSIGSLEAAFVATSLALGVVLELPAALDTPVLFPLRTLSVTLATLSLVAAVATLAYLLRLAGLGKPGVARTSMVAATLLVIGNLLARVDPLRTPSASAGTQVLLGLDSLSQSDPVDEFRRLAADAGGTWYEHPVTPGLLTNAVWTAILSGKPSCESGVFFVFQSPDWSRMPDNLVSRANRSGIHTVSFFSDQFTTHVGSDAPFREDRSGPRGWLQVGSAAVKNASFFLPVLLPHLPRIPGAPTTSNQSGTFAYSLRRELGEILAAGRSGRRTLAIGHLDYLHQPRFPGYSELSWEDRRRVLRAPVRALADPSLNWQYPPLLGEAPLPLYRFKLAELQHAVSETVRASGFLDPGLGNQLIVLSDHGSRAGVTNDAFSDPRFHRVLLFTFGVPARDPRAPISLIDVGALLGLSDAPAASAEVAYVNARGEEWTLLLRRSTLLGDGAVRLDPTLLASIGERLLTYAPFGERHGYRATAVLPAPERENRTQLALTR